MFLKFKRKASPEAIEQYKMDRAALRLMRAELEDIRVRYPENSAFKTRSVESELSRVIRRVDDALKSINFLIGE